MSPLEKKTTRISDQPSRPLDVEWTAYHPFSKQVDGSFQQIEEWKVTISIPPVIGRAHPLRLVDLSPQTALNLLAWLQNEQPTLEALIQEEEDGRRGEARGIPDTPDGQPRHTSGLDASGA